MEIHLPGLNKPRQKELLILILCLLIGFALRYYTFDQKSLWEDEIHTFNDSRDGLKGQLKFYKENPTYLHPPLFFVLTHLFYSFPHPERDLRIIPLIFGTLSIPMIYLLARSFSPPIALPCTLSLTFMAYHISLSQDGRSYSLIMFLGMVGFYFLLKHLETQKRSYLLGVALSYAILLHTSYSSISFITLSQLLWFYRPSEDRKRPRLSSFLILNSTIFLLSLPWILFVALNYKGQTSMPFFQARVPVSFWSILYGIFHDWVPHAPLMAASIVLFLLFPLLSKSKRNTLVLLSVFFFPIVGLYLFCKLFDVGHFVSSRYFVNFLPLFFVCLYLSIRLTEDKLQRLKRFVRLDLLFIILFIGSNLLILPLYYRFEKQDLRGLATYLKTHLKEGDKIFDVETACTPGILHYFGIYPEGRHYLIPLSKISEKEIEFRIPFVYRNRVFTIYYSENCCDRYIADGGRLWIVAGKWSAKKFKKDFPCVLKGYFDGSFLNFSRFPEDASIYLFLLDPRSPNEKGMDLVIE